MARVHTQDEVFTLTWNILIDQSTITSTSTETDTYTLSAVGQVGLPQKFSTQVTNSLANPAIQIFASTALITDPSPPLTAAESSTEVGISPSIFTSTAISSTPTTTSNTAPGRQTQTTSNPSTIVSSLPTASPSQNAGLSHDAKIGIGVGVSLGVLGLAAVVLAALYLLRRRGTKPATDELQERKEPMSRTSGAPKYQI